MFYDFNSMFKTLNYIISFNYYVDDSTPISSSSLWGHSIILTSTGSDTGCYVSQNAKKNLSVHRKAAARTVECIHKIN